MVNKQNLKTLKIQHLNYTFQNDNAKCTPISEVCL